MHKVMTRTPHHPAGPPTRRPVRPPATAPDGSPAGPDRTEPPHDRRGHATAPDPDQGPAARHPHSRARPADTRPPSGPGRRSPGRRHTGREGTPAATSSRATAGASVPTGGFPGGARPDAAGIASRPPAPPGAGPTPGAADLFAERLLAVLCGLRPVHSMLRHTVGRAYDDLARLAERGPLRTRGALPVVRAVGWDEPRPGALEVFARIGAGGRLRAMAFRLERGHDLRWRCAAVELGGPRTPGGRAR
ncbi:MULTISPECIES: Rv3235 family protein [unclassified Streptomyces]|uniref:Rv3235 family protein n=1 Tax=unclassified Streptomyces TaxID=2593676 RepID=UPI001902F186|nr:Rv3235 family protein [Streptomyces sp. HSG2]